MLAEETENIQSVLKDFTHFYYCYSTKSYSKISTRNQTYTAQSWL